MTFKAKAKDLIFKTKAKTEDLVLNSSCGTCLMAILHMHSQDENTTDFRCIQG